MQISSAYQQAAFMGAAKDRFALPVRTAGAASTAPRSSQNQVSEISGTLSETVGRQTDKTTSQTQQNTTIRTAHEIFENYDFSAISPREIDQLSNDLKAARFDDLGFVMGLEREGANYRQEMESSGRVYGIGDAEIDTDSPINLIEKTRSDLALAQRYGQETERLSAQLSKLEEAQMNRAPTAPAPRPQLAENLVLFQAQCAALE